MNPTLTSTGIARYRRRTRDPVRLTALIYLREALIAERYEDCTDFIAIAKEFGALDAEIRALLEDPRRHPEFLKADMHDGVMTRRRVCPLSERSGSQTLQAEF